MLVRSRARQSVVLALIAALIAGPALAADTGNGSKNFSVPNSVPNYFSNEAGPMQGPASETRRGELYPSQVVGVPAATAVITQAPRERQYVAMAEPRGRFIRGRRGEPVVARHVTVHGRSVTRVASHGSLRVHTAYVATRSGHATANRSVRTVSKTTRVSTLHHHARG
jgi:hypothetical protein